MSGNKFFTKFITKLETTLCKKIVKPVRSTAP